jgi:transcriptional regulator with XRE-family HTH domain
MTLAEPALLSMLTGYCLNGLSGKQVETSGDSIGRYERDEVKPSIEVVIRLADALEVLWITSLVKLI